jgi:carboxylesterase
MSTPASMPPDPRMRYLHQLRYVIPRVAKEASDFRNPEAAKVHVDYPYFPTKGVAELNDLLGVLRQNLARVTAPILMAYSHCDTAMIQDGQKIIYDGIQSTDKEVIWLENSGHVITEEPERMIVFEAANRFIRRIAQAEAIPA